MVAALRVVDAVVIFDEETPFSIVSALQPDVLVKGADWAADAIVGRDVVEARGGRVVRIPLAAGYSTSAILARLRPSEPGPPDSGRDRGTIRKALFPRARIRGRGDTCLYGMTTTTSLALQSLLLTAVNRSGLSRSVSRITGLSGSARALAVAATANRLRSRPVLFVLPTDAALDDAVDDVRFLLRSLEGLADAVAERVVLPFPSLQVDPVPRAGPALQGDVGSRAGAACAGRRATARPRRVGTGVAAAPGAAVGDAAACRPRSGRGTTARRMT